MNKDHVILAITTLLSVAFSCACAQSCAETAAAAAMARAKTVHALTEASKQAGESYRARLIFAYRSFQLHPGKEAAQGLLALLPADDSEQITVMTLGDSLCDEESVGDMKTFSRVYEGLARALAKAVLLEQRSLPAYVRYALVATGDPHSDYAVQMKTVCQHAHLDFVGAVKQLPQDKQPLFAKHVMDPTTCRPLAIPEAER